MTFTFIEVPISDSILPRKDGIKPHDTIRMLQQIARKDHADATRFLRIAKLLQAKIDTSKELKRVVGGELLGELDYAIEEAEKRS